MTKETVSESIATDRLLSENPELTVMRVDPDGHNADEHPVPITAVATLATLPETLWVIRSARPPADRYYQDYIATERRPPRGHVLFRVVDWGPESKMRTRIKDAWEAGDREPPIPFLQ